MAKRSDERVQVDASGEFIAVADELHKFSSESDGDLYVVNYATNRLQKFKSKADTDQSAGWPTHEIA